jgi:hypothetical protein
VGRYLELALKAVADTDSSPGALDPVEAAPDSVPARPADRQGMVTELILSDGKWLWRHRRRDAADKAYAAWVASGAPRE